MIPCSINLTNLGVGGKDLLDQCAAAAWQPRHKDGAEAAVVVAARTLQRETRKMGKRLGRAGLKSQAHSVMPAGPR